MTAILRSRDLWPAVSVHRWSQKPEMAVTATIRSPELVLLVPVIQDTEKTVSHSGGR